MNKYKVYQYIDDNYKLKTELYKYSELQSITNFPVIIKPALYSCHGSNVSVITNQKELKYIYEVTNKQDYIVKEYYPAKYEVGVLYEKNPLSEKGNVVSVVLKHKLKYGFYPLNCDNILLNKGICKYIDKPDWITDELIESIRNISDKVPNHYVGRYDIGFNNVDDFKKGINYKIFELNGNTGIDLRITISDVFDFNNIKKIMLLLRFIFIRVMFGFINII
jgi:hypothetical protein